MILAPARGEDADSHFAIAMVPLGAIGFWSRRLCDGPAIGRCAAQSSHATDNAYTMTPNYDEPLSRSAHPLRPAYTRGSLLRADRGLADKGGRRGIGVLAVELDVEAQLVLRVRVEDRLLIGNDAIVI